MLDAVERGADGAVIVLSQSQLSIEAETIVAERGAEPPARRGGGGDTGHAAASLAPADDAKDGGSSSRAPVVRRIAVFDFDQTLAADEVTNWIDRASMVPRGFGGAERVAMLRECLQQLTSEHLVPLAICSVNSKDIIKPALQTAGLFGFFGSAADDNIFDREQWAACGGLKSRVIAELILPRFGGASTGEGLLFVDDDPGHVRDVRDNLPMATTILVPRVDRMHLHLAAASGGCSALPAGGMLRLQVDQVLAWASGLPRVRGAAAAATQSAAGSATGGDHASTSGDACAFVPKTPTGPLSRRCATCGRHSSEHGAFDPGSMV